MVISARLKLGWSGRVHIDNEVPPGLYDDLLVTQLHNLSADYVVVASFGFHP